MIVAFTGHRPNKLGGHITPNPRYNWVCWQIEEELLCLNPEKVISGMALGVDQWAAQIAIKLQIPFIAAVPFKGQEAIWPKSSQREFNRLLAFACGVVTVSPGEYTADKMQTRNKWMVDRCDVLLAIWDGSSGGTGNCVKYAKQRKKQIVRIQP